MSFEILEAMKTVVDSTLFRLLILIWATSGYTFAMDPAAYFDMTDLINDVIKDGDKPSKDSLQQALNSSRHVFYSTDFLLNKIADIAPVIDALNKNKLPNSSILLTLSLRYTRDNTFYRNRLKDVFYDFNLNFTSKSWSYIFESITKIVLDFRMNVTNCPSRYRQSINNGFLGGSFVQDEYNLGLGGYSASVDSTKNTLPQYLYPKFVKNFLSFYSRDEVGNSIQIGVLYNPTQLPCMPPYFSQIVRSADFVVKTVNLPSYSNVQIGEALLSGKILEAFVANFSDMTQDYLIMQDSIPASQTIIEKWNYNFKTMVLSSSYHGDVVQEILTKVYQKNLQTIFNCSRFNVSLVYSSSLVSSILTNQINASLEQPLMPMFRANEITSSACDLANTINSLGSGSFAVNHETWRALLKYQLEFDRLSTICPNSFVGGLGLQKPKNVHLIFDKGIKTIWPDVETSMKALITKHKSIGNNSLKTVMFHERDIFESTNQYTQPYQPIVNFMQNLNTEQWLNIGCVITLAESRIQSLTNTYYSSSENNNLRERVSNFCKPIFESLHRMVRIIPKRNYQAGCGENDDVVALRKLFLKEFPKKQVLLINQCKTTKSDATKWANFFEVPIIFESALVNLGNESIAIEN